MRQTSEGDEVPFNFAMLFYEELAYLRRFKSQVFITGNIYAYRDALEEIFTTINFKLSPLEKEKVITIFNEAQKALDEGNPRAKAHLRAADMELLVLMDKYKMIFPGGKRGGMNLVNAKYKLGDVKK